MTTGQIIKDGEPLIESVELAESLADRLRGLLGRESLKPGCGLVIKRCGSVHTVGMRFPLDLFFVDRSWRVVRTVANLAPGRAALGGVQARAVIEIQSGWLDLSRVKCGDSLLFSPLATKMA